MTQAFYTAISGMTAGQTKISVVADNIANLNTVGFKASKVNFSDIYYRTSSTGQAPTGGVGGTNPKQIGIGAQTASIARDFSAGTTLTTGLTTDLCINGNSFFTVASPTVEILYTRDGNFKIDADGHLVTSTGYKVLGTSKFLDTKTSTIPIKIPTYVTTVTTPTIANTVKEKLLNDLNAIKAGGIKEGDFDIINEDGSKLNVQITGKETVDELVGIINTAIKNDASNKFREVDPATGDVTTYLKAKVIDGRISFEVTDKTKIKSLTFENGTSNIVTQFGMNANRTAEYNDDGSLKSLEYHTDVLNYTQTFGEGIPGNTESENYTSLTISESGIIEVKYGNNDSLSVMQDPASPDRMIFKYTLNDGVIITGDDLIIKDNLVVPENLQIQFASFVNPNGLKAEGNNTYASGPNCGMALFGSISSTAFGSVKSGLLEGSNVDLATEFADMVVAQRAIEANSRVFDTSNQILQTLARLGQ